MITDFTNLHLEISKKEAEINKLKKKLYKLPAVDLSRVYLNGCVYGICYEDGHGKLEACEVMSNQPTYLNETAEQEAKGFLGNKLYIVSFKPVSIISEVRSDVIKKRKAD